MTQFLQLNHGWNAHPNDPDPKVRTVEKDLLLSFRMNSFQFTAFDENDVGLLRFFRCSRYRLGSTNDEGWYRGQCRFSEIAPAWGELYELTGDLRLSECPEDWILVEPSESATRHFLFYLRNATFECEAIDWKFTVISAR